MIQKDYATIHASKYKDGRVLQTETINTWIRALEQFIPVDKKVSRIIDVGSGTGRFAYHLSEEFGADVFALDASLLMLKEAQKNQIPKPQVYLLQGFAEQIPVANNSIDIVFCSMVFQFLVNPIIAVSEFSRLLKSDGVVFVRTPLSGYLDLIPWYRYFPAAKEVDNERFPSKESLTKAFQSGGFTKIDFVPIKQKVSDSFRDYYNRYQNLAISTFSFLKDDEIENGLDKMRKISIRSNDEIPVFETVFLGIFKK